METHIVYVDKCFASTQVKEFSYKNIEDAVSFVKIHATKNGKYDIKNDKFYNTPIDINAALTYARELQKNVATHCPGLDFVIVDNCNLKCANCSAIAPLIHEKSFAEIKMINDTCAYLRSVCGKEHSPLNIHVHGGEPLLHQQIADVVVTLRKYFPDVKLRLETNGLLLPKLSKKVLNAFRETCCDIAISVYNDDVEFVKSNYSLKENVVDNKHFQFLLPTNVVVSKFSENKFIVDCNETTMFANGDLLFFSNCHSAYIAWKHKIINNILVENMDYVNIYNLHSFADLEHFFNRQYTPFFNHFNENNKDCLIEKWHQLKTPMLSDWFS